MHGFDNLIILDFSLSLLMGLLHIRVVAIIFLARNLGFEAFQIVFCALDSSVQMSVWNDLR